MQSRVGKDSVKFLLEIHLGRVHYCCVKTALLRSLHHRRRKINALYRCAKLCDLLRQRAIAAANVQDLFSSNRLEQAQNRSAQIRDKSAMSCIIICIPSL